jgi:hypothetical protein
MTEKTLIEQANEAAERLEKANKASEEIVARLEAIEARRVLGGISAAGNKPVEPSKEEQVKSGMKKYFQGTAIEKAFK